ncbi:MAG: Hsp20/alpha crystallin family protein, partial [Steroidobacteraceae bacterium]
MFERFTDFPNSLLNQFWRLQQEMDEALGMDGLSPSGAIRSLPRGSFPAVSVLQTPDQVEVYLFAPGLDPKKLDISVQQDLLKV